MVSIENPFQYPEGTPQWIKEKKRQYRRDWWAKKLGREIGEWGGKREGAGRPKRKTQEKTRKDGVSFLKRNFELKKV